MYFALRKTDSRGRSGLPLMRSRMRVWRLRRSASRDAFFIGPSSRSPDLAGLAGLAEDVLARVANALSLVGFRLPLRADVGRDLADELLVGSEDAEPRRCVHPELDPCRGVDLDRVRVAEREHELRALQLGAVPDAGDLQVLREAGCDAGDHVVHEGPCQAMQRAVTRLVARADDPQLAVLALDRHLRMEVALERAERALDRQSVTVLHHLHARWERDGHTSDSGHAFAPYQT